jgi:hypothetical protein
MLMKTTATSSPLIPCVMFECDSCTVDTGSGRVLDRHFDHSKAALQCSTLSETPNRSSTGDFSAPSRRTSSSTPLEGLLSIKQPPMSLAVKQLVWIDQADTFMGFADILGTMLIAKHNNDDL